MHETALAGRPGMDGLPCGWLRVDHRGLIVRANARLAQLAGREGVVEGLYFDDLLTLPSRVLFQSHLSPLLRLKGETAELNVALRRSDGAAPLDVLLYSCRAEDLPGHIDFVVVPIRQRRRIEDELVRVKRAADQAPLMVFQLVSIGGEALHFAYASQSVRQLYGCTPEAAAASARAVTGRLSPESAAALAGALDTAARTGMDCRLNLQLTPEPDQPTRTHEFVASPRPQRDGHTLWHGYIADITERLQLQREAAEREAARQAAQLRKDFLARASHELRTPLNAILGFAQLLGQAEPGQLRPDQMQALATLQTAGRHMLALVNQLLDLSRADREADVLPLQALPLAPELSAAAEAWRGPAHLKGQQLDVQLPPELADAVVLAEPVALRQVLANLLSNAVKYTPAQGHIGLQAATAGEGRLRISVVDDGPGLDEAQRSQLFEPFNRLGAQHGPTEGSGLGLVLSRRLVQALGGELTLEAGPGPGCRFSFELARALHPGHGDAPVPVGAAPTPALPPATRGCVLYVEDNEVNVLLMQAIAALRPGVQLHVARNGREAEALLDDGALQPDLLLLDLNLPDTGGPELLQRLRRRPALAAVPALLVTATTGDDAAAASGDFQGCWFKPLDLDHTLAELDRLLA
jgi:signal transduction histidine kinase/CheY-like chemotaxis protein